MYINDGTNKNENEVSSFIPLQISRNSPVLKTEDVQPTLGNISCTKYVYAAHNVGAFCSTVYA